MCHALRRSLAYEDDARAPDHARDDVGILGDRDGRGDAPVATHLLDDGDCGASLALDLGVGGVHGAPAEPVRHGEQPHGQADQQAGEPVEEERHGQGDDGRRTDEDGEHLQAHPAVHLARELEVLPEGAEIPAQLGHAGRVSTEPGRPYMPVGGTTRTASPGRIGPGRSTHAVMPRRSQAALGKRCGELP